MHAQAVTAPLDRSRLAAIGFCFGGVDIAAVAPFHGGLAPLLAKRIRAHVSVMNGADDSYTMPGPHLSGFMKAMWGPFADRAFVARGHAVYCYFTKVGGHRPGCRYDAWVPRRSYRLVYEWLR